MEVPKCLDKEWDSLPGLDLYTASGMPEATKSEGTMAGISNITPNTNTGGSSASPGQAKNNCQKHKMELLFFCKEDQLAICALCLVESHNGHIMLQMTHPSCTENPAKMEKESPEIPSVPKPISITSVKTNSVCLTWGPPEGLSGPLSYLVTWRSEGDNDSSSLTISGNQVDIQNLTPGQKYTFTVATLHGANQSSTVSATAVTEVPTPDNVLVKVDQTSASVTWSKPKIGGDDEVSYEVILTSEGECPKVTQTRSLQCSFEELTMGREYSISVAMKKNEIQSEAICKTIKIEREDLEPPDYIPSFQIEPLLKKQLIEEFQPAKKGQRTNYFRLKTKRTCINGCKDIRRWTFGKRDPCKAVRNILLVGETGTGKTTLINALVNYLFGVKWDDGIWLHITEEDQKKSQAKSQTTAITVYEMFLESSPSFRIIDTPGYGSTDGRKFDKVVAQNLHVLFRSEDGIHEISAVGLVAKSGQNRLTDFQRYIFDAVLSLFGTDIEKNIVVLITHSDGLPEDDVIAAFKEMKVSCAKDTNGVPVHFQFNNRQSKGHHDRTEKMYRLLWDTAYNSLESFLIFLDKVEVIELSMTAKVLAKRERLEACVTHIHDNVKLEELKQTELQQTQTALEGNKEKMGRNEDFTYEVEEPFKQLEPIDLPWWNLTKTATCCMTCKENCHYPGCWWVKDISWCSVMKDNSCTVCTKKCPVTDHFKQDKIYVPRYRKVTKTYHDLKIKYNKHVDIKKALEEELHQSVIKKNNFILEAYQCIMELEEIALKKDSVSTLMHLNFLIEKMKQLGDDEKVQKLVDLNKKYQAENRSRWAWLVPEILWKRECEKVTPNLVPPDTPF